MATVQETLSLAVRYHQSGRLAEAGGLYRCILDAQPDHPDALHLLGLILANAGNPTQAIELMRRAIDLNPALAHARYNLANVLKGQGALAAAEEHYRGCLKLLPDFAPARGGLGATLAALGRTGEAVAELRHAGELAPTDANVFAQLGAALLKLGRVEEAIAAYDHLAALAPGNDRVHMTLAALRRQTNRLAEATDDLRQAAALNPANAQAHDELGQILEALRVWDEAAVAYGAALELRPGDAALRLRHAKALRNAGRNNAALEAFARAAELGVADGEAHHQRALILREKGRLEEAAEAFRAALAVQPNHAPAHFHLGLTLLLLGRPEEAFDDRQGLGPALAARGDALLAAGRLKDACAFHHEALLFRPDETAVRQRLHAVLERRRALCRPDAMTEKEHTDEWGNIALYEAMDLYSRALRADPRLAGVPAGLAPARPPRVFDAFTFYNELDLLELRLEELYDHVDAFVIVEAPWTFQGKPKPLVLKDNLARFARFADKIVHVVADGAPGPSPWDREKHQRDAILRGLEGRAADGDVVFVTDVDEIPRPAAVDAIRRSPLLAGRLNRLSVDYSCGFVDFRCSYKWHKLISLPYGLLKAMGPDLARFMAIAKYGTLLYNCGWHFSWLGGIETVIGKLRSYAHSEYTGLADQDPARIRAALRSGRGIFALMDGSHGYGGEFRAVPLDEGFPAALRRDPERYRRLGWFYDDAPAP